jgi:hypothetical protein
VAQFDIYVNPIERGKKQFPFVCLLQNKLFDDLSSQVIAFVSKDESIAFDKVSVPVSIDQQEYFICLNVLATIESRVLNEFIENVSNKREDILSAYDALFTGI